MLFLEKLVALVSMKQSDNGMNPSRVFIYAINSICAQNMSSNGMYQLVMFPRKYN